jgi:hydroxymethylbilane synthase
MSSGTYTLGTLDGRLNRAQTRGVIERLQKRHPQAIFDMVTVTDPESNRASAESIYSAHSPAEVQLLMQRLLNGEFQLLDLSAEDLPLPLPDGLVLAAVPDRDRPYDALLNKEGHIADELPDGSVIGVLSRRSQAQIASLWPALKTRLLAGGAVEALDTYLQGTAVDGLVLPAAVAERLGVQDLVTEIFFPELMLPGAGQGLIALLARAGDTEAAEMAAAVESLQSRYELLGELYFRERICAGQDCPLGVLAQATGEALIITGAVGSPKGDSMNQAVVKGKGSDAQGLGTRLAEQLLLSASSLMDLLEADFPEGLPLDIDDELGPEDEGYEEPDGFSEDRTVDYNDLDDLDDFEPPRDD